MRASIISIFICLIALQVRAHDPDQISYRFMRLGEEAKLEVHLTPVGAFDLLRSLHHDLNDSSIIRLSDYSEDFEQYFNQTINLKIENKNIRFSLSKSDLRRHDAVLYFDLVNFKTSFNQIELKISSFTEIYRNTGNHVTIAGVNVLEQFKLDLNNQTFSNTIVKAKTQKAGWDLSYYLVMSSLLISVIGIYLSDRKKSKTRVQ